MTELGNMQTSQCGFEDSACGVPGMNRSTVSADHYLMVVVAAAARVDG